MLPGTVKKPTNSMARKSQFTDLSFKKGKYDFFFKKSLSKSEFIAG